MADVKPDLGEPINLKLKAADGGEVTMFKVKRTTKFKKIKDAYASRMGQEKGALAFMFDSHKIDDDETPAALGLEDEDQITVMVAQSGGAI